MYSPLVELDTLSAGRLLRSGSPFLGKRIKCIPALTLLLVVIVSGAYAAPIVFSGADITPLTTSPRPNSTAAAAAFDAAASALVPLSMITFENVTLGPIPGGIPGLPVAPGVTMVGAAGAITENPGPDPTNGFNTTAGGSRFAGGDILVFRFDQPVQAFGAFLTDVDEPFRLALVYNNRPPQGINVPGSGTVFIGITDIGHQITAIVVNPTFIDRFGVDDVRFGAQSVFLPDTGSTLMLLSSALAGLGVVRRIGTRSADQG